MPAESTRPLARRIFRVVLGSRDVADADLLRRFAAARDEEAFAELVRRHGPMVLGVCRRVTGHPIPAEVGPRRAGDPAVLIASSEKIRAELGWTPRYPEIEQIVASAWEWHQSHPRGYAG